MNPVNKITSWVKDPQRFFHGLLLKVGFILPDKVFLSLMVRNNCGYWPNWKNPSTFNEKIQWLKLYNRRPEYTTMVDKYVVKEYVANIIGEEYIIPTIGVWNKPEEIDWDLLPNQFVLKTTHGGGNIGVVICKDKATFSKEKAIEKLNKSLKQNIYKKLREWPYKNVPRRILAEKYIEPLPKTKDLPDYKWYCFDGEPKYCQFINNRSSEETIDFFDTKWNHQEFIGLLPSRKSSIRNADFLPKCPDDLEVQIEIASKLSKGLPFSRIDLYSLENSTYFGEITFYPASGLGHFRPERYNEILGEMIKLPGENFMCGPNP